MPFAELEHLLTRLLIPCILLALAAKLAVHIILRLCAKTTILDCGYSAWPWLSRKTTLTIAFQ